MRSMTPLRALRMENHLLLIELAARARVSEPWLCRIEKGDKIPSVKTQRKLARALQVPVEQLWPRTEPEQQPGTESVLLGGK